KYLAAPTAGLVLGEAAFVAAVQAQQKGIGRAMKPSKEALVGVLAALAERARMDLPAWQAQQARQLQGALQALSAVAGLDVSAQPDPLGAPFSRLRLRCTGGADAARRLVQALKAEDPSVWVMEHGLAE